MTCLRERFGPPPEGSGPQGGRQAPGGRATGRFCRFDFAQGPERKSRGGPRLFGLVMERSNSRARPKRSPVGLRLARFSRQRLRRS
jgi:hypothetical protein